MNKVIITSDSTSDLTSQIIDELDIRITPLYVNIGDDSFKDGIEISQDEIFKSYEENGVLAKTSAIPIYDFQTFFKNLLDDGYEIIHFSISSLFSSSYQNAINASNLIETDKISIVDSMNLSTGIGLQVMYASEMAKEGLSRHEIVDKIESIIPKINASFVIDNLTYLWKGGRCSGLSALGANLIQIKPSIEVIDGTMKVGKKYRGSLERCLKSYIDDRLKNTDTIDSKRVFMTHTIQDEDIVNKLKQYLENKNCFEKIIISSAGCTISCHCGPGTFGIFYINN